MTVSHYEMAAADYLAYARHTRDEQPLYLFDQRFTEKTPALADYTPPPQVSAVLLYSCSCSGSVYSLLLCILLFFFPL